MLKKTLLFLAMFTGLSSCEYWGNGEGYPGGESTDGMLGAGLQCESLDSNLTLRLFMQNYEDFAFYFSLSEQDAEVELHGGLNLQSNNSNTITWENSAETISLDKDSLVAIFTYQNNDEESFQCEIITETMRELIESEESYNY